MTLEEQEKIISELEIGIERLRALYNQYFMGIERMEPTVPKKEIERKIQILRRERIMNTALRFRYNRQVQKYNTHIVYWRRICRQIEIGTYKRDMMRAMRHSKVAKRPDKEAAAPVPSDEQAPAESEEMESHDVVFEDQPNEEVAAAQVETPDEQVATTDEQEKEEVPLKTEEPRPNERKRVPPRPAPSRDKAAATPDTEWLKKVYLTFVVARKKCNESTDNLSFEKVSQRLVEQYQKKGGNVDFKVTIRNGKAAIKTVDK